jgi:hypothetical protein
MKPLFGLDPNVANTIITAISTLVAGFIGGWVGSRATRAATERALAHNLRLQEDSRRAALRGVLLGIRAEFEALVAVGEEERIGPDINAAVSKSDALHVIYPIHLNYFVIYESNASLIGQIPEDELRSAVIGAYISAASLISALKHNSEMESNYREITAHPSAISNKALHTVREDMAHYAPTIKGLYEDALTRIHRLFKLMDECDLIKNDKKLLPHL